MTSDFLMGTLRAAGVTAVFTLGLFGLENLEAEGAPTSFSPLFPRPALNADGCVFTVSTDRATYEPGQSPVLTLVAVNPTTAPIRTSVNLRISSMQPSSPMSRVMVMPVVDWAEICAVDLEPGEQVVRTLATSTSLSPTVIFSLEMVGETETVHAGNLEVVGATGRTSGLEFLIPSPMLLPEMEVDPMSLAPVPVDMPMAVVELPTMNAIAPGNEGRRKAHHQTAGSR